MTELQGVPAEIAIVAEAKQEAFQRGSPVEAKLVQAESIDYFNP
ncbi:hypothetical protein MOMUL_29730 [Moorella mulderi DSM 14980]|uniref:Uncharacterized protein n=1 Tax=Moorella mulderi DSM 14980 TaxID=1122241 RepID=A0A151ASR4_9FIRM|nr:hypothetical protein MOMUL_29730 [Moorella mulderi DSM 14980]